MNAPTRMQAQTSALRGLRSTNEMLSNYGLARSLNRAPSSGMDETARRMPAFQNQMQGLRSLETAQLDVYGHRAMQATLAAQAAARRKARKRYVRTQQQPSGSALADAINKAIASGMSEDAAAAAASKAYMSNDYSGFEAHYEAQDHYEETAIRNLNPVLNTLDPRAAATVASLIQQKGVDSGRRALYNMVGATDPREVHAINAKIASGKATATDYARLNAFMARQDREKAQAAYTKQMVDMPYREFAASLSEAQAELDAALKERSKTYTDDGAKKYRRENGELVPMGDWSEADEKQLQALQAKVDRLKGYESLRKQAQTDQYANLDDDTLTAQENRLSGYIKEIRENGYINGDTDRVLEAEYQQKLDAIENVRIMRQQQKRVADYDSMMSVKRNADFALKSQHGANTSSDDLMHAIINGGYDSEKVQRAASVPGVAGAMIRSDIEKAGLMTPDEVAAYNYHFSNGGKKEADAYLDSLETYLNERRMQQLVSMVEADTQNSPAWLGTIVHGVASVLVSPAQITGTVYSIGQELLGREIDPYHEAFTASIYVDAVRTKSAEKVTKEIYDNGGSDLLAEATTFGYQTIMSIADNLYMMGLGGLAGKALGGTAALSVQKYGTLAFMSSGAAATTIQQSITKGYSQEEAMKLGVMAGSFEALFEEVSLDNLLDMSNAQASSWIFRTLTQAGIEATEEGCTEIASLIGNYAVLGSRSDYEHTVRMYVNQGVPESQARSMAFMDMLHQVAMAMAGGALSGGIMGGGFAASGDMQLRSVGKTMQANGQVQTLLEEAQSVPSNRVQKLYAKINNAFTSDKKSSNLAVGRLNYLVAQHNIEYANALIDDAVKNGTIKARDAQLIKQAIEEDSFSIMPGSNSKAWGSVSPEAMAALATVLQQEAVTEVTPNPEAASQRASEAGSQGFRSMQTSEERAQLDMQAHGIVSGSELARFADVQNTINRMQEEQYGLQVPYGQRGRIDNGARLGTVARGLREDAEQPAAEAADTRGVGAEGNDQSSAESGVSAQEIAGSRRAWDDQDQRNLTKGFFDFNAQEGTHYRSDSVEMVNPKDIDDETNSALHKVESITHQSILSYAFKGKPNGMYGLSVRGRAYASYVRGDVRENVFQGSHEICETVAEYKQAGRDALSLLDSDIVTKYQNAREGTGDENELICDMFGAYMVKRVLGDESAYDIVLGEHNVDAIEAFEMFFDDALQGTATTTNNENSQFSKTRVDYSDILQYKSLEELLHKQITLPKKVYNGALREAYRQNRKIALENDGVIPKLSMLVYGNRLLVYMNFDEQGADLDLIFVDQAKFGSARAILMEERLNDTLGRGTENATKSEKLGNEIGSGSATNSLLWGLGGKMQTDGGLLGTESKSIGKRVRDESDATRRKDSFDGKRGTGDNNRGGIIDKNGTSDGAFSVSDPQAALDTQTAKMPARPGTAVAISKNDPTGQKSSFSTSTLNRWRDTLYQDFGNTSENRQMVAKAEEMRDFILRNNGENGTPNVAQYAARGDMPYNSRGPLRKNIEYTYTFDIDANCERRLQYAAYLEKIQSRVGRLLTLKESRQLVELMRSYEQMIPCTYCYVEGKRMQLSNYMLNFLETRRNVLNAETDSEALAQMYSYDETKKTVSPAAQKVFDEWRTLKNNGKAKYNPTAVEHFFTVQNSRNNIYSFLDEHYGGEDAYIVRDDGIKSFRSAMRGQGGATKATMRKAMLKEFGLVQNSVAGRQAASYFDAWFQDMMENTPHVLVQDIPKQYATDGANADALALERDASNYAKSASQARNEDRYQPYTDQVRKISDKEKKNINARGGFRIHSSNDFQVQNVLDYMQFFMDLATVGGWMSHTYTKNPAFVDIFGANRARYNMSIAMYGDDASGIRPNEQEGMGWRDAKRLRKKFNNAGTIAMVVNDDQLSYALNSDWVDMVIPFHASGMEKAYWYNVLAWVDYTARQNEAWFTTDEKREALREKGVDVPAKATSAEVDALFKKSFKQIIDEKGNTRKPHFLPYEQKIGNTVVPGHNNDKETYLALCKEYGVKPRFAGVMVKDKNGKTIEITEHENYIKVIKETSRTDTPQETVTADVDLEAAKKHLIDFAKIGGYSNYQQDPFGIVDEFLTEYAGKNRDYGWLPERAEQYMEFRGVSRPVINAETRPNDLVEKPVGFSSRRLNPLADQMYDMRKQGQQNAKAAETAKQRAERILAQQQDKALANQIADMRKQAKANRAEQQSNLDKINALNQRIERMEQARQRERESLLGRIDKKDTLVQEVRAARDRKLAEQKAKYTERLDAKNATIKDQREQMKSMKVAERRKLAEQREKIQERQKREKRIKNITKNVRELASWLERPTKDAHVPDFMRGVVGDLVTLIDIGKEGKTTQKSAAWRNAMQTLSTSLNAYAARQADGNSDHEAFMAMLPDGFTASLSQFVESMTQNETQYLGDMSDEDIRTLNQVVGTVRGAVKGVNRLYSNMKYASIQEMAEKTIEDGSSHGRKRWRSEWADNLLNSAMLDAYSFGHKLGETGDAAIKALSDGYFGKTVPKIRQALEFFEGLKDRYKVTAKNAKSWADDAHEFDVEGGKVYMSTQQLMNLYALSFRPQAMQHILSGGIQIAENEATRKSIDPNAIYKVTESDLDMMFDTLTDEQKSMVSDMQRFLSVDAAAWGNEVTQDLYMFDGYGEDFYWPIESSPTSTGLKDPEKQRTFNAMMNSSFTKSLNHFANNPVVLRDAFSVFTEHCVQMANYNGLAIPIQDTMKWLNYKSRDKDGRVLHNKTVQLAIKRMGGDQATGYITEFLKDINGLNKSTKGSRLMNESVTRLKRAAIAGKIRVVIQQPTAVVRALAMVDARHFVATRNFSVKRSIKEMLDHAPIAWWKANGNYDIGIGRSMVDMFVGTTGLESVTDFAMKPAGAADNLGWSWIWNAVRNEVKESRKDLKVGSDEFFDAVTERFNEVVSLTQVVDTPFHRAEIMRDKDSGVKQATAFASEPVKQYNMLYRSIADVAEGKPKALDKVTRTAGAIVLSQAINAIVTAAWDAARKRGKDDEETYLKLFGKTWVENFTSNLNPLSSIVLLRDVWDTIKGEDAAVRMDLQNLASVVNAVRIVISKWIDGESRYTDYYLYSNLAKSLSDLAGLPFGGIYSSAESIVDIAFPDLLRRTKPKLTEEWQQDMRDEALAAGMRLGDFYDVYEDIGKQDKSGKAAQVLYDSDLNAKQKAIMAQRVSESLDNSLAELRRRGASNKVLDETVRYYAIKNGLVSHHDDPASEQFKRLLLDDETLTAEEKTQIYTALTKESFTGIESKIFRSEKLSKAEKNALYEALDNKAEMEKILWDNTKLTDDERHSILELGEPNVFQLDFSSADRLRLSSINETTYNRALKAEKNGVSNDAYLKYYDVKRKYANDDSDLETGKADVLQELMNDRSLTAAQKIALETAMYEDLKPEKADYKYKHRDYTDANRFYLSGAGSSYPKKGELTVKYGINLDLAVEYVKRWKKMSADNTGHSKDGDPNKKDCFTIMESVGIPRNQQNTLYKIMSGYLKE